MNDEELEERLRALSTLPLEHHPQALEALARHVESELEELRRGVPAASRLGAR